MFGLDPKALLGGDLKELAEQLQGAADGGQFNPMAMFAGTQELHSVFLGPLTTQVQAAIQEFLSDGSGPFAGVVDQIKAQEPSLDSATARQRARDLFANAQGFCVIVLQNEQGLLPMTHLFFGSLPDEFIKALADSCKPHGLDAQVQDALERLRTKVSEQQPEAHLCYLCDDEEIESAAEYWYDLGEQLWIGVDEGIMPGASDQLRDLAFWIAAGMVNSNDELDGDELLIHARCCALAGELDAAIASLEHVLSDYEPDEEDMVPVCEQLGQVAIQQGQGDVFESCLQRHQSSIDALFADSYEIARLRFRLLASSGVDSASLLPAAQRLFNCDAKSCRHDLNKEPVWLISKKPTGSCLDTADAADFLDRSLQFIGKRIDNATIPVYRDGDDVLIPEQALAAWKDIMQTLDILD